MHLLLFVLYIAEILDGWATGGPAWRQKIGMAALGSEHAPRLLGLRTRPRGVAPDLVGIPFHAGKRLIMKAAADYDLQPVVPEDVAAL